MTTIAIIGASADRKKFGNKAVRAYLSKGYKVVPINHKEDKIEGIKCYDTISDVKEDVHMVSLYLPPEVGIKVLEEIKRKGIKDVYINPGAESEELIETANQLGLNPITKCSILSIGVDPIVYDFS